jgi:membrane protein
MWLAFSGLYIFMSNTRVDWQAALAGGVAGGTLWQLAQVGYVHFQVGVGRYNAIYGTMAALPIFMVWLYVSWVIVLFGLGICYAKQNLRTSGSDLRRSEVSRNSYEEIALAIMVTLAERFQKGQGAMGQEHLASFLFAPPRLCRSILKSLVKLGYVAELQSKSGRLLYQLGRAADSLTLREFFKDLRHYGKEVRHLNQHPQVQVALQSCLELETIVAENLGIMSLKDLVEKSSSLGSEGTILLCDQSRSGE